MNRTAIVASLLLAVVAGAGTAQVPANPPAAKPQADPIEDLVAAVRAAEAKLTAVVLTMSTSGRWPGDLAVSTRGELRVLRGKQPAVYSRLEYSTADGLKGRSESAQTAAGIVLLQEDLAFGASFVQIDPKTVADLEWAGTVLRRDDLPGMEARAAAPLGSGVLAAVRGQFVLAIDDKRKDRNGEAGTWLVGKRRPGLDAQDPDLAAADSVELFVRTQDHAVLEMREFTGEVVTQRLTVERLEIDARLDAAMFAVDGGGQRPAAVQANSALGMQIEQALLEAEAKSEKDTEAKNKTLPPERQAKPEVRPSKR